MTFSLKTKVASSLSLILILLLILSFVAVRGIQEMIEANRWVQHTYAALDQAQSISASARKMESGARGYLLAGQEEYLEPYTQGGQHFHEVILQLQALVSDNPRQVQRLSEARNIMMDWKEKVIEPELKLRRKIGDAKNMNDITILVKEERGKQYFDEFRQKISVFIQREKITLDENHSGLKAVINHNDESMNHLTQIRDELIQTYTNINLAKDILNHATDMETGMRGFLLAGKEVFLEPYEFGKKRFSSELNKLKQSVADTPAQVTLLEEIDDTIQQWQQHIVQNMITLRREIGHVETMDDIADMVIDGQGKKYFAQFLRIMDEFIEEEQRLMEIRKKKNIRSASNSIQVMLWGTFFVFILGVLAGFYIIREILRQVGGEPQLISNITAQVAEGQLNIPFDTQGHSTGVYASVQKMVKELQHIITETGSVLKQLGEGNMDIKITGTFAGDFLNLKTALESTALQLADARNKNLTETWLKTGQTRLNEEISGEQDIKQLAENIINFLTPYVEAEVGVFHLLFEPDDQPAYLKMMASHAYVRRTDGHNKIAIGEGIVGQAAYEKKMFTINHSPQGYINIQSSLGDAAPTEIIVIPFMYETQLKGVVELASFNAFTDIQMDFLQQSMTNLGIAINTAESRTKMKVLLQQSQEQADTLKIQQEKMQEANEELQSQTEEMQSQQEELETQQEELRQTNEELEERGQLLVQQQSAVTEKNQELEKAKTAIQSKAEELELASKYKSEFLANMSHELRTPLNSLLILAQLLVENKEQTLTTKQIECAETIHSAGTDLLTLINEILDLSKVEAGKIEVQAEQLPLDTVIQTLKQKFQHVAEEKSLYFNVELGEQLPDMIYTDTQRLHQIINNLLSNAFKFTEQGGITLTIRRPAQQDDLSRSQLNPASSIALSVEDTGIGIPEAKQKIIFEAFQQADGTTSRRFGGTGLGLSISRQLVQLMGGEIQLHSEAQQGSCFTIFLPEKFIAKTSTNNKSSTSSSTQASFVSAPAVEPIPASNPQSLDNALQDDREHIQAETKSLLIVEDDMSFARVLMDLAREKGFQCIVALDGRSGLQLAETYLPSAIMLDIGLPQMDGWSVMEHLKDNPATRHIPVHFISGDAQQQEAKKMGAIGYALKPASMSELGEAFGKIERFIHKVAKNLLLVTDNQHHQESIIETINNEQVHIVVANTCAEAWGQLQATEYECIVLDITIEHNGGVEFLNDVSNETKLLDIPIIIYTERDLTEEEEMALQGLNSQLTLKSVRSPERLLDEATLFLHEIESHLPQAQREVLQIVHDKESILKNKKVLLVDDDARNVFALTAVLEGKGMQIVMAVNGKQALASLDEHQDVHIVLMDIMMPEMDGYEAIAKIREQARYRKLPIIALTAKAMKGDANKCIEAGASDYLAKPVDTDKLLSLMRVWCAAQ